MVFLTWKAIESGVSWHCMYKYVERLLPKKKEKGLAYKFLTGVKRIVSNYQWHSLTVSALTCSIYMYNF